MEPKKVTKSFVISLEDYTWLEQEAKQKDLSTSRLLRQIINEYRQAHQAPKSPTTPDWVLKEEE